MYLSAVPFFSEPCQLLYTCHLLSAWIRISCLILYGHFIIVHVPLFIIYKFTYASVGWQKSHTLVILVCINFIVLPYRIVIVNVPNHKSVTIISCAERYLLTVLQDVVLIFIASIINNVCHALFVDGRHLRYLTRLS